MNPVNTADIHDNILVAFEERLNNYIKTLNAVSDRLELKACISFEFKNLIEPFVLLGNHTSEVSVKPKDTYLVNYILSEDFKIVMLLHRDVFLELNKASICKQENTLSDIQIINHFSGSKEILIKKLEDFKNLIVSERNKTADDKSVLKRISLKISHQTNPWNIYKSQFETIISQIATIDKQKVLAFASIATFNKLKEVVIDLTHKHKAMVGKISDNINHISRNTKEDKGYNELLDYAEEQLAQQSIVENKHFSFSETVNDHINQLQKIEIPVGSINGLLTIRDVDLKKRTQKWFDYQILPEFMDLIGLETNLINKYSLSLINLKNSLQLAKDKLDVTKFNSAISTLSHLEDDIKEIKTKGEAISNSLKDKVNNELLISNLIKGKHFLDVTLNSSLNVEGSTFIKNIKAKVQKGTSYFNSQYKKSLHYESLSNIELSTQCIAHRMYQDENTHYDSLFLNKQFIGDLFLVPRKSQETKLKQIVGQWNQGFNKSVLVSGDRLSGRSTFLDYSAKKLFGKDIVTLSPNSDATIDGRKFKTSSDLKEALQYVKNNNIQSTRPIILIDDLELWRDAKHSLLHNIRALINFIETESDDAFVMASTTNMMVNHLSNRLNFSNAFSHIINVNEADEDEIVDAILLRHGAAHRDLITENLEVLSNKKLRTLAHKLSKQNVYNFGNTLQSWTYNTFVQDNEKVVFKNSYYEFLDFFTSQEVIILKQALMFNYISEYSIKNFTTTSFDTEFKSALRRLMNTKVLMRNINGNLYINPVVINDVTKIINNKTNI
tara:strand:+ start:4000 stop:6342 length:2343 start_codon:yes stop_codon:yes gene_type:complete